MDFLSPWGNPTENRPRITVGVLVGSLTLGSHYVTVEFIAKLGWMITGL